MKASSLGKLLKMNSGTVATILGLVGFGVTSLLLIDATVKLERKCEEEWRRLPEEVKETKDDFTIKEKLSIGWKFYIPPLISGVASAGMVIVGNRQLVKELKAVTALYSASEAAATAAHKKIVELYGKTKAERLEGAIAKDEMENNPQTKDNTVVPRNGRQEGDIKFYDRMSGRYCYGTIEHFDRAINNLNAELLDQDYVSLNDFYYEMDWTDTELGAEMGWNTNSGRRESLIEMIRTPELDPYGNPVIAFTSRLRPRYDYRQLR